jgi:hypothetical protein
MKKLSLCCVVLALLITGCATTTQTALQRRTYEAKELEGTFDDAFKATMQVLQDNGYVIKNTDHAGGVIQAETGIKKEFWSGSMTNVEITATLEQFGANTVKERLSLIRKIKNTYAYGTTKENSEIIDDPELFQKMYDEIQKEMFIRKNLNR